MPNDPFLELARSMNLYHTEADQTLGHTVAIASVEAGLSLNETARVLRAVAVIAATVPTALFADRVVETYVRVYQEPDSAVAAMERIASYLGTCSSIEEFELLVAKQTPPKQ